MIILFFVGLLGVVMTIVIVGTVVVLHLPDVAHLPVAVVVGPGLPTAAAAAVVMEVVTGLLPEEVIQVEVGAGLLPRVIDRLALVLLEIGPIQRLQMKKKSQALKGMK